jgi:glycosyltransferase involved in cell wall biosynthesis
VSVGRLVHWKGFELGVRAFARADVESSEFWVVGDGPERARMETVASSLGVEDRVRFIGRVDRSEVLEILTRCDVLVHPSFHDSGGWICLEAMAASLPVICLDLAGPAVLVGDGTGFKVSEASPAAVIERTAGIMRELAASGEERTRLGTSARQHVASEHTWKRRADQIVTVYEQIVSSDSSNVPC